MLPTAPAPGNDIGLTNHVGVWTGKELLIHSVGISHTTFEQRSFDIGYNPATSTWRRLPVDPYPVRSREGGDQAVWDGREMLVFGMTQAAYSPATNRWRQLPDGGPGGPSAVVWTGRQVLLWGGGCCGEAYNSGSAFDPAAGTWQPIPAAPLAGRFSPGVWTGRELIVIGGAAEVTPFADGAAYNPDTRTWRRLPSLRAPRYAASLTWTGTEVIVAGGLGSARYGASGYRDALAYSPATNTWRQLPSMGTARYDHAAVWTGRQLLVWGGASGWDSHHEKAVAPPHGLAYNPTTNRWSPMPKAPLRARTPDVAVWTGAEMIIWGSSMSEPALLDGAAYRPPQ